MTTLTLAGLTRRFGPTIAVDNLDLDVASGEFICLLGPSGCGKSTALRMIGGFEMPDSGDIRIDGQSVLDLTPNRRPTSMVFQSQALWSHMTVFNNIAFGLKLRGLARSVIADKVLSSLTLVGLTGYENRKPAQLSGGQQQRVALARSLVLEPKILLLDEPFSALDAHLRVRLREELKSIQRRLGLTTLFVTHDQEEAMVLADRIVVMNAGRVEQVGRPGEIYDVPQTAFAARFIGTMSFLPAFADGDVVRAGDIRINRPARTGTMELALRPEDCRLVAAGEGTPGRLESIIELGALRIAEVRIADGHILKIQVGRQRPAETGAPVGIVIERALLYRDDCNPDVLAVEDFSQPIRPEIMAAAQ